MGLARQLPSFDAGAVGLSLLSVLRWYGVLLVLPLVVAVTFAEWQQAWHFAALGAACFGIGATAWLSGRPPLAMRDALATAALAYPLLSVVGGLPYLAVTRPVNALFEAMSGWTTTGLTVVIPEQLPESLLFYRAYTQWLGGGFILVLSLWILGVTGRAAIELYRSEIGKQPLADSLGATSRFVLWVYGGLTAFAVVTLLVLGVPFTSAVNHSLTMVSTAGFSTYSDSVAELESIWVRLAFMVYMVLGATSFVVLWRVRRDGWSIFFRDQQVRFLALVLVIALGTFFVARTEDADIVSLFNAVSASTTTGYSLSSPVRWPDSSRLVAIALMIIGGAAGSTAGGIRIWRLVLVIRVVRWAMHTVVMPRHAKVPVTYGGEPVSADEIKRLVAFLAVFLGMLFLGATVLVFGGFDMSDALFESTSALCTVGLSSGITAPGLAAWAQLLLVFLMWAGRLEVVPVLLVLSPVRWDPRRVP